MRQLGMFAKYWQAGTVKTRLAAAIGDQAASDIYYGFLRALVRRLGDVADYRIIAYTPQEHRDEFETLAGRDWATEPQAAGDLGQRMANFFATAFRRSPGPVVLIGSDSPTLPTEYIDRAFEALQDVPVVLGPSIDGGYYLIGAVGTVPSVFTGVTWSTDQVYGQTIALLRNAGCRYLTLPAWYDVDDFAALHKLRDELAETPLLDNNVRNVKRLIDHSLNRR